MPDSRLLPGDHVQLCKAAVGEMLNSENWEWHDRGDQCMIVNPRYVLDSEGDSDHVLVLLKGQLWYFPEGSLVHVSPFTRD